MGGKSHRILTDVLRSLPDYRRRADHLTRRSRGMRALAQGRRGAMGLGRNDTNVARATACGATLMETERWTRRRMLKAIAAAAAGSTVAPFPLCGAAAAADLELRLMAAPGEARIRDGAPTRVLSYTGEVLRGRADALRASGS